MANSAQFKDGFWSSRDGLKLHYRDYEPDEALSGALSGALAEATRPAVLCLHGLSRNARDFDVLAPRLRAQGWHVLCPDLRGRGESDYARDAASYTPEQYALDLTDLITAQGLQRFVVIGTSLGGLIGMGLASLMPERVVGAVINDVGPWLEPAGMERIRDYVGQGRSYPTWVHAARGIEDAHGDAHPGQPLDFWIGMAKRLMTLSSSGRIVFDYDMKIAEPMLNLDLAEQPDLWPFWENMAGRALLVVRGSLSDVLSLKTLAQMLERVPEAEALTLADVGHAPTLDEPEAVAAIEALLARVA
ncbi:alpha/beta hydrolase [Novosphingobium sp. 1949]|uniref:Alpha/beta hydrolase n=1 Tax=Novosphingobium organovorum TaxID=2930092 RepID=A0ABT0BHY3_9SPHN|nr:alpha/beta hydrolase [Novosphingobium organovorum]MCJ2184671.1 alpha/beta hydrolase [Novosphingobium organovorum]